MPWKIQDRPRLYRIYSAMRSRCNNPNFARYADYGGRGIMVCAEWDHYAAFRDWALANGYAEALTIERTNNDLGYSPANCVWITRAQQARNKRNSVRLTGFGETKTAVEWSEDWRCVVSEANLRARVRSGWDVERAMTEPRARMAARVERVATVNGETLTIHAWSVRTGINFGTLYARHHRGLTGEQLLAPVVPHAPYGSLSRQLG